MTPAETVIARHIAKETRISVLINSAFSLVFFAIVFGVGKPIQVWGPGNWVFDFIPQSFMIALMSTLIPGLIVRRKLQAGVLVPTDRRTLLRAGLFTRSLLLGILCAAVGAGLAAAFALLLEVRQIPPSIGLPIKVAYGGLLALVVTPLSLRAALTSATNQKTGKA